MTMKQTHIDLPQFRAAMAERNLTLSRGKQLVSDGQWQRCDVIDKKPGNNDGSYKLCVDGPAPWGLLKNWTDGKEIDYWRGESTRDLTDAERKELERRVQAARLEAEKQAAEARAEARKQARAMWRNAKPASASHPYLKAKKIKPHGLRVDNGCLLVPMEAPDDDEEPVNLQFIDRKVNNGKCDKWFLRGGRAKGCFFTIEGKGPDVVVAEGFATVASIIEPVQCHGVVAFNAGNLPTVASTCRADWNQFEARSRKRFEAVDARQGIEREHPPIFADAKLIIAADDDWKTEGNPGIMAALRAARASTALIAVPDFGNDRPDDATDFNDLARLKGPDAVKACIKAALPYCEFLKKWLLKDPDSAFTDAMLAELAWLIENDRYRYEDLVWALKKQHVRIRPLEDAVKAAVKQAAANRAAARAAKKAAPPDVYKLAQSAAAIIASEDVLELWYENSFRQYYTGERKNAYCLYLSGTSRLFEKKDNMHPVAKGTSSIGKSALLSSVVAFFPPEDVHRVTAFSDKALLYMEADLQHKIFVLAEAQDAEQLKFQNYLVRELISEGRLTYPTVRKVDGEMVAVTIVVEGPVTCWTSTTRDKLHPENETRLLSLELDDSEEQTKRVMKMIAEIKGGIRHPSVDLRPWHDYQRYLAAGERRVTIPFALVLAGLIPAKAVRLRRDFSQLLCGIKAHALLHREHRQRTKDGEIIANIDDDYEVVRWAMADILAEASEVRVRKHTIQTAEAVEAVQPELLPKNKEPELHDGATVRAIAKELKLDISATYRRLSQAQKAGLVVNLQQVPKRAGSYRTTGRKYTAETLLPTTSELREAYEQASNNEHQNHGVA
jgi:phage/plasmid primase-like uncharacterized protein